MDLTIEQMDSLIRETSNLSNDDAQMKMFEVLANCDRADLLYDTISAYDILKEHGGWRATDEIIKDYTRRLEEFMQHN